MDWHIKYKEKLVTAREAVANINSGDRVVLGHAIGEPRTLVDEMVANKDFYEDVEIVQLLTVGKAEYTKPEMKKHFRFNAIFVSPSTRGAVADCISDYTPCFFFEVPRLFKEGYLPVDVALVQVSPPDPYGFCSLGVSVDFTKSAVENAKIVIAEVNDNMPKTLGQSFVHINDIDYLVKASYPLVEINPPRITEVEKAIGENCASLIEDGSTLQLGIGSIPDAVLSFLKEKKDLGIHSEMISDGVVELIESGVITNRRKAIHRDKIVAAFLVGTKKLYDFVDNNPMVEMHPVDYVNNPTVIMKNHRMISINSCVQVDFMGQVASESIGLKQISGVGGQVDFVRGVSMAEKGKSIIAMPSTTDDGKISKIVPVLDAGAAVTTSRNDVHYIVTEYGIAELRGKSLKERAKSLINIAHPDFRLQLIDEWEKRFKQPY